MARGQLELQYGPRQYSMSGGWFWPAGPGPRVKFHLASGCPWWEHRYVAFQGALVNEWIAAKLWPEAPQLLPHKSIIGLFDQLLVQAKRTDAWGARRATNLLEQILLELAEARRQNPEREAWLELTLRELNVEGQFTPDYNKLARECGMGLSTLRRRFKDATGITLHNYVMQRRIGQAKDLLGSTDWPLKQIADELHFSDVYFFANQFRKLAGVAPATFRKSRQA
jgi:AraC-like DNA-binding protein